MRLSLLAINSKASPQPFPTHSSASAYSVRRRFAGLPQPVTFLGGMAPQNGQRRRCRRIRTPSATWRRRAATAGYPPAVPKQHTARWEMKAGSQSRGFMAFSLAFERRSTLCGSAAHALKGFTNPFSAFCARPAPHQAARPPPPPLPTAPATAGARPRKAHRVYRAKTVRLPTRGAPRALPRPAVRCARRSARWCFDGLVHALTGRRGAQRHGGPRNGSAYWPRSRALPPDPPAIAAPACPHAVTQLISLSLSRWPNFYGTPAQSLVNRRVTMCPPCLFKKLGTRDQGPGSKPADGPLWDRARPCNCLWLSSHTIPTHHPHTQSPPHSTTYRPAAPRRMKNHERRRRAQSAGGTSPSPSPSPSPRKTGCVALLLLRCLLQCLPPALRPPCTSSNDALPLLQKLGNLSMRPST